MKYNRFNLSRVIMLLLFSLSVFSHVILAQNTRAAEPVAECPYPSLRCYAADPRFPNVITCIVGWPPDSTGCRINPPDPWPVETPDSSSEEDPADTDNQPEEEIEGIEDGIPSGQSAHSSSIPEPEPPTSQERQWRYYWETSDGFYSVLHADTFTYTFRTIGTHEVRMSAIAIYSPNDRPPRRISRVQVNQLNTDSRLEQPSNFDEVDDVGEEIKVETDWPSAIDGDTITLAISYRNNDPNDAKSGLVQLNVPEEEIQYIASRGRYEEGLREESINGTQELIWDIGTLQPREERAIFVDFFITRRMQTSENPDNNMDITAGISWEKRKAFNLWCFLGFHNRRVLGLDPQ